MIATKDFIYFIVDKEGRSYVVENGRIKKQALPQHLTYSPDGWKDVLVGWERDFATSGLVTTFSFPLRFSMDGRRILFDAVVNGNVEADLHLLIKQFRQTVEGDKYYPLHRFFHKAPIDLSAFEDDGRFTTVTLMDKSLAARLKKSGSTKHELDLDSDTEAILVRMDGIEFTRSSNFMLPEVEHGLYQYPQLTFMNSEGLGAYIVTASQDPQMPDQYFIKNTGSQPVVIKLEGPLSFTAVNSTIQEVWVYLNKSGGGSTVTLRQQQFKPFGQGATGGFTLNESITLGGGESLSLQVRVVSFVTDPLRRGKVLFKETKIKATYTTRYGSSYVKAFKPLTALKRLADKTTGEPVEVRSQLLSENSHLVITSGDAIRGLPGAKVKTSFNEFFEAYKVVLNAGIGTEGEVVLMEDRGYFYNPANPIPLGKVKNLKISHARDLPGNTLRIGYEVQNIDDVNGKFEFNNSLTFKTPYTREEKELSFVCPYITQPYYAETLRINLDGRITTDNQGDNEVFMLNVVGEDINFNATLSFDTLFTVSTILVKGADAQQEKIIAGQKITVTGTAQNNGIYTVTSVAPLAGVGFVISVKESIITELDAAGTITTAIYSLRRAAYDTLSGVPTNTVFNIEQLTPKRLLLTNLKFINSHFHGMDGQRLTFQTTEKNDALKTVQGSLTIEEKADLELTADKYFQPFYLEFEPLAPITLAQTLEESPNRAFSIEDEDGNIYVGFLGTAGLAPSSRQEQTFKLLSAAENDLSKLI